MTDKALFKTIETPSVDERVDRTGMVLELHGGSALTHLYNSQRARRVSCVLQISQQIHAARWLVLRCGVAIDCASVWRSLAVCLVPTP